ncbi:MAG: hypothetical protein SPL78_03860 [Bacteroidales bacterium]|nr:hypothetical protein [Bacteroidales bacterium]
MNYKLELYRQMVVTMKRGNFRGVVSNAKPIFLLSLIELVPFCCNKIMINNTMLSDIYIENRDLFKGVKSTPMVAPFFHLNSEPFYHLVWKKGVNPPPNAASPSAKFLREHLQYAKLDDDLWELLQDKSNREYLKNAIINQYLKN